MDQPLYHWQQRAATALGLEETTAEELAEETLAVRLAFKKLAERCRSASPHDPDIKGEFSHLKDSYTFAAWLLRMRIRQDPSTGKTLRKALTRLDNAHATCGRAYGEWKRQHTQASRPETAPAPPR